MADIFWLQRGPQRQAVARVLRNPMTPQEIWAAAQQIHSKITLNDVCRLLREFIERELTVCLTPREPAARLFALTDRGRDLLFAMFQIATADPPRISWARLSAVLRGPVRRVVVLALGKPFPAHNGKSARMIHRELRDRGLFGRKDILRALQFLQSAKLIRHVGYDSSCGRLYQLTSAGEKIYQRLAQQSASPQTSLMFLPNGE